MNIKSDYEWIKVPYELDYEWRKVPYNLVGNYKFLEPIVEEYNLSIYNFLAKNYKSCY